MKDLCINCKEEIPSCRSKCSIGIAYTKRRKEHKEKIDAGKYENREAYGYMADVMFGKKKGKQA